MSFVSFSFLFLFALSLGARAWIGPRKNEKAYLILLMAFSLVFYGAFIPRYLWILFFTTGVDYWAGWRIHRAPGLREKRPWLVLSLTANLGLLAYFKYSGFAVDSLRSLCASLGWGADWVPRLSPALPIGISFFTLQSMSYTLDLYRGKLEPVRGYWRFLLFVCFYTHLVSGPIVRAKELLYQFDRRRRIRAAVWMQGAYLMILGFFLKIVVADHLAEYVDRYWVRGGAPQMPASVPWALAFLFSCQIFADFFGYTNIALGAAYLLGFKLPRNFNNPYLAGSFREFWTRWHITLSRWIRDYLYLPLGGGRGGAGRAAFALMITFLLAGLWHGAALTFLVWGAFHGLALLLERGLGFRNMEGRSPLLRAGWFLVVQLGILVSWVFFRASDIPQGFRFLANMTGPSFAWGDLLRILPAFLFAAPVLVLHVRGFLAERGWFPAPGGREKAVWAAAMLYAVLTLYGKNNAFIYFQF
ncbi:MAG TPA: MBOAT family O-acyltransferase [bacterium]|nr:MBOAT family O-acyltransferase [bacterium]